MSDFLSRYLQLQREFGHVCMGMDPASDDENKDFQRGMLTDELAWTPENLFSFAMSCFEEAMGHISCVKPNLAFWEACWAHNELRAFTKYCQEKGILVIGDGKRGDIGATAEYWAYNMFVRYGFDAATVNAYLGPDTLTPWLKYGPEKAIFVLAHTTNPGAGDFQEKTLEETGNPLFVEVAKRCYELQTPDTTQIGFVMASTFPKQFKALCEELPPTVPLLIPGIGKQAGDLEATMTNSSHFKPRIINISSGITKASRGDDYAMAAGEAAKKWQGQILEVA